VNLEAEHKTMQAIRRKQERGEKLTTREQRILAYSPLGSGQGCGHRLKTR